MAKEKEAIYSQLRQIIDTLPLPAERTVTPAGQSAFKRGVDKANDYVCDVADLEAAILAFHNGDCLPIYYAGLAYLFFAAARITGTKYDFTGLVQARTYLKQAAAVAYDFMEFDLVSAFVEMHSGEMGKVTAISGDIRQMTEYGYFANILLLDFFLLKGDDLGVEDAYRRGLRYAHISTRRAFMHRRAGEYFLALDWLDRSLLAYEELVFYTPDDPLMLHNMSLIQLRQGQLAEAWRTSHRALSVSKEGRARDVRRRIVLMLLLEFGVALVLGGCIGISLSAIF
jgi:hypothetical protein